MKDDTDFSQGKVVLKFSASWCGPCKTIAPFYRELAEKSPDITFYHIDVDHQEEVAETFKVSAMPTFISLNQGQQVAKFSGADKSKLISLVETLQVI